MHEVTDVDCNMETTSSPQTNSAFFSLTRNPLKFRLFLLKNLPAAYFSGLKVRFASQDNCIVSIPYKWFTRNPFRSTYFACMSMAAEMTTGILAMANVYQVKPKVSMLVVSVEGRFYKKATDVTSFICEQGRQIRETIDRAKESGEPQTVRALSSGFNKQNELVAEFWITWSFKVKNQ
jgi:hypothetical protein